MEYSTDLFHCPLCHRDDAVTKVSAIFDSGSVTSVGYHVVGHVSGTSVTSSSTALASKFAPPTLPRFRIAPNGRDGLGITVMIILGIIFVVFGSQSLNWTSLTLFDLIFVCGLGFILYPIIGLTVVAIRRNRLRPGWQKARATWEQLYYCARNDVVFIPGSSQQCVPSSQVSTLLYPPQ